MHINEMKRRMENIGKIGRWQDTIEGWKVCVCGRRSGCVCVRGVRFVCVAGDHDQRSLHSKLKATVMLFQGEDILATSSQMLRCGELHKISKGHSQERHFFLFDHQLIYCKKVRL